MARLISRVGDLMRALFARPGRYAARVTALFPEADPRPSRDARDATYLTDENRFDGSRFTDVSTIQEDDVVRWLYETLRVPRTEAAEILEPFFAQMERVRAATQAWAWLLTQQDDMRSHVARWLQKRAGDGPGRFQVRSTRNFQVECVWIFGGTGSTRIVWHLPREPQPAENVEPDRSWILPELRDMFEQRYRELCPQDETDRAPSDTQEEDAPMEGPSDGSGARGVP
jgi:hypothetical protein